MNNQDQLQELQPPKKRGRRLLVWLGRIVAGLVILSLIGAVFELVSEASDTRAYPPPGQMVDVGGYRLHIDCTGTGSPTVVIEAGLGDWSTAWGFVQTEVAKTTRVCTYDRAGSGWSESVRSPGMPANSLMSCTPCCKKPIFRDPSYWSATLSAVYRYVCLQTIILRKSQVWY